MAVHESAIVEDGAKIGDFTNIWHFSHIEARAIIGENCNIGQNCYVGNDGRVGNGCRLGNSVSIFSHVTLEDFVFCAPFMVFTHIGYPRAAVNRHFVFKTTHVRTGATLGANCTILPGLDIGMGAFVGAGATLSRDCKDWALMVGVPARHVGWVSAYGERIPLPLEGAGRWTCEHTGDVYELDRDVLVRKAGPVDLLRYTVGEKLIRPTATR